jgi:transposase
MTIETVIARAAGLDIAKASLVAWVRVPTPDGGWQLRKRKFATMTADLGARADWLAEHRVTRVGMESTLRLLAAGVLPARGPLRVPGCWGARHLRTVPGRTTDRTDAQWIGDLLAHGLVRPGFVPPPPIRRRRDRTRCRSLLLADRSREKQRMPEAARRRRVKLSVVASDLVSTSGRAMLAALIAGERTPQVLAEPARGRLRVKIPALTEARAGRFAEHPAVLARMIGTQLDAISARVAELDARIDAELAPYRPQVELLDSIDGIETRTAQVIIAEIGGDRGRFPSAAQLASGAGVCRAPTRPPASPKPPAPGQPLAHGRPGHRRPGRSPQEGLLPARPVPPHRRPPRRHTRPGRGRAQPAGHHLACAEHPDPLPGSGRGLLPAPRQPRTPSSTRRRPASTARLPGHPPTRRLTHHPAHLTDFRVNPGAGRPSHVDSRPGQVLPPSR